MANLTLKSGYNVTLTEDPANGTLTISATRTSFLSTSRDVISARYKQPQAHSARLTLIQMR